MVDGKKIDLGFGVLSIHDKNVTSIRIKEEFPLIKESEVLKVVEAIEANTEGNYALISNRKSDYSTDIAKKFTIFSSRKNLKCIAVVAYRDSTKNIFELEKKAANIITKNSLPFEMFTSLNKAVKWSQDKLATA